MSRLPIAYLIAAVSLAPAGVLAQSPFDSIQTPHGTCRVWVGIPGGSDTRTDGSYNRCALESGPHLLTRDLLPPAPRSEPSAGGSYTVVVNEDGTVDPRLTRAWTHTADSTFNHRTLETILRWRFQPGIRNGRPVRSGFRLHLRSDFRNDTLPSRLEWTYNPGLNEDTLRGSWIVEAPPPPFTTEQLDSTYAALLRQLVAMRVVLPAERLPWQSYCLVLEQGDSAAHARLFRLATRVLYPRPEGVFAYHGNRARLAPYGCERDPRALRIVLPRVHRTENDRAVLRPSGDHLRDWPPGFEGRTYRAWMGRCVATVPPSGTVQVGCSIHGDPAPDEDLPERTSAREAAQPEPGGTGSLRLTVVAMTRGAFQKDTLQTLLPEAAHLSTGAIRDPNPTCGGWAAYSPQETGELYVINGDLERGSLAVTRVNTGQLPTYLPQSRVLCDPENPRKAQWVAFLLGDLGDPIRLPVTLCVAMPGCSRSYLLAPDVHTLAGEAHLRFQLSDLRPETRVGDQLVFRIYTDRALPDLLPLVLIRSGNRWIANPAHRIDTQEWEHSLILGEGYKPETEVRVYLLAK